jgi:hypothetical protein
MFLQSMDNYDITADFDPSDGSLREMKKSQSSNTAAGKISGSYARLNGNLITIYRNGENLHVSFDSNDVEIRDSVKIFLDRGDLNVISLVENGIPILSFSYKSPLHDLPEDQFDVSFSEKEDFDFGLFLYNVISNPERRDRIYKS